MDDALIFPELPADSPAGPSLELDPAFAAMEVAAKGKRGEQFGSTVQPDTPPDWKETASLANGLLEQTRDLRVLATLSMALLHLRGFGGFAQAVASIRHHLDTMWDHVHPQLDPEDDNDPMQRANALLLLKDAVRVLRPMRDLPLASTPRTGPVSWRDIAVMNGIAEPEPGREKLTEAIVRAAFAGTDATRLAALRASVDSLAADLAAIPAVFDARSSPGSGPDLQDVTKVVQDIQRELVKYATAPAADAPDEGPAEGGLAMAEVDLAAPARAGRSFASIQAITSITSRDDALHAMNLAAEYFRTNEPSSPLPLLIDRALRLAPLPFLDILRNLAPDGLMQAQNVVGNPND